MIIQLKKSCFKIIERVSKKFYSSMMSTRVVFVLGAPGSGKGTQCSKIVEKYGFTHLSAGDLLRAERSSPESEFGELIADCIKEGKIVPVEITCRLLEKAIEGSGNDKILIDGFPRNQDNLDGWTRQMNDKVKVDFVLFIQCPEEVCTERILNRGKTSGRTDDNADSLKKRFITYVDGTMPIVNHYKAEGKVRTVQCNAKMSPDEVFEEVKKAFSSYS